MIEAVVKVTYYAAVAVGVLLFWGALGSVAIAIVVELFFT